MDMKEKLIITNVTVFPDKKTGEIKTRIGFLLADKKNFVSNRSYKGYAESATFYNGDIKDKVPDDAILSPLYGELVSVRSQRDPLRSFMNLKSFTYNGHVVNLL